MFVTLSTRLRLAEAKQEPVSILLSSIMSDFFIVCTIVRAVRWIKIIFNLNNIRTFSVIVFIDDGKNTVHYCTIKMYSLTDKYSEPPTTVTFEILIEGQLKLTM